MIGFNETSPSGIVLLYHRVAQLDTDPQLLAVAPEHFAKHLEILQRHAAPMELSSLCSAAAQGTLDPRAVAVTFDDGYADNFCRAEPTLRRVGVPATIFATTGNTDTNDEFFWDELDRLVLQPHTVPEKLVLLYDKTHLKFDTRDCAEYSRDEWERLRGWNVLQSASPGSRQRLYFDLCGHLHRMTSRQRETCLRQLQAWAGLGSDGREINRMMNSAELCQIGNRGLIEIGAHTVSHPLLASECIDGQIAEIRESKSALEAMIGRPVTSFSYPFGTRHDYSSETVAAVRAAGFELACSNFAGKSDGSTDRYELPRFIVRDWDGDEFERRLNEWFAMRKRRSVDGPLARAGRN